MVTTVKPARRSKPGKPSQNTASARRPQATSTAPDAPGASMVVSLARQLQSLSGAILGRMGTATDVAITLAQSRALKPGPKAAVDKAAALLRDLRQTAGLTIDDVGRALELDDPSFMGLVEGGKVGLPFELILRLAAVLGRNDPVGFILQMTRSYNPKAWKTLEALGVGRLLVQAGREREFANIYRSHDAARSLSDADFAAALEFANAAFKTALEFQTRHGKGRRPKQDGQAPNTAKADPRG